MESANNVRNQIKLNYSLQNQWKIRAVSHNNVNDL